MTQTPGFLYSWGRLSICICPTLLGSYPHPVGLPDAYIFWTGSTYIYVPYTSPCRIGLGMHPTLGSALGLWPSGLPWLSDAASDFILRVTYLLLMSWSRWKDILHSTQPDTACTLSLDPVLDPWPFSPLQCSSGPPCAEGDVCFCLTVWGEEFT